MKNLSTRRRESGRARQLGGRALLLLVSLVSLYLVLPSLLELFTSWGDLYDLSPEWVALAVGASTLSFAAIWELQRIALGTRRRLPVSLSQLAGNSVGRVIPGGGAAAMALQYRMLARAGIPSARILPALTGVSVLLLGTVLALPLLSLPAIVAGTPVDRSLAGAAALGVAVFLLIVGGGVLAFAWDRPLLFVGEILTAALNRTLRRQWPVRDLPRRLLGGRDSLRSAFGRRWRTAVLASAGRWILDYIALIACLKAVDAQPDPSLVLLAYVGASVLGLIPFTPGGLGFVEAGLTGMLALAGIGAAEAAVATLAYRLVSFWLPIPAGGVAYLAFRRRYRLNDPG